MITRARLKKFKDKASKSTQPALTNKPARHFIIGGIIGGRCARVAAPGHDHYGLSGLLHGGLVDDNDPFTLVDHHTKFVCAYREY